MERLIFSDDIKTKPTVFYALDNKSIALTGNEKISKMWKVKSNIYKDDENK